MLCELISVCCFSVLLLWPVWFSWCILLKYLSGSRFDFFAYEVFVAFWSFVSNSLAWYTHDTVHDIRFVNCSLAWYTHDTVHAIRSVSGRLCLMHVTLNDSRFAVIINPTATRKFSVTVSLSISTYLQFSRVAYLYLAREERNYELVSSFRIGFWHLSGHNQSKKNIKSWCYHRLMKTMKNERKWSSTVRTL